MKEVKGGEKSRYQEATKMEERKQAGSKKLSVTILKQ